jgi:adenylate cyclase
MRSSVPTRCSKRSTAGMRSVIGTARRRSPSVLALNYGPVVLGDVGIEHSMSFTVVGDTVNTASRLQALTRTLDTPLVVGGPLVDALRAGASDNSTALVSELIDQGEQSLRGRTSPVHVWTHSRHRP